jgi:hypothetical protein
MKPTSCTTKIYVTVQQVAENKAIKARLVFLKVERESFRASQISFLQSEAIRSSALSFFTSLPGCREKSARSAPAQSIRVLNSSDADS